MRSKNIFLDGPIVPTILSLSLPTSWGLICLSLVAVVDAYYVGSLGATELAAVGIALPVTVLLTAFPQGIATSMNAILSRQLGKDASKDATQTFLLAVAFLTFICLGSALVTLLFASNLLEALGGSPRVVELGVQYLQFSLPGIVVMGILFAINGALRVSGDSFLPGIALTIAALTNGAGDYLLVHGALGLPAMGLRGAAIASSLGWIVATLVASCGLRRISWLRVNEFSLSMLNGTIFRELCSVGAPATIYALVNPTCSMLLVSVFASGGTLAAAAYAFLSTFERVLQLLGRGVSIVMGIFVAQNYSALRHERISQALRFLRVLAVMLTLSLGACGLVTGGVLAAFFTPDRTLEEMVTLGFSLLPWAAGGYLALACGSEILLSLKHVRRAMMLSLLHKGFVTIPMVWVGMRFWHLSGASIALAIAGMVGAPLAYRGLADFRRIVLLEAK